MQEFPNGPAGLRMVLRFAANELRQRDVERLMGAMSRSTLGTSTTEHAGKVLRAAVEIGWVQEPVLVVDKDRDDVADMLPWQVTWYAGNVNRLYIEANTIPKA